MGGSGQLGTPAWVELGVVGYLLCGGVLIGFGGDIHSASSRFFFFFLDFW